MIYNLPRKKRKQITNYLTFSSPNPFSISVETPGWAGKLYYSTGTAASTVSTHNGSTSAHSTLFAKKQDKLTAGTDYATPEQLSALKTKVHKVSLTVVGWDS